MDKVGFAWENLSDNGSNLPINADSATVPQPASNHPGGVVATFCDGHVQFLADSIEYWVYVHLMTPNSGGSGYNFASQGKSVIFDEALLE